LLIKTDIVTFFFKKAPEPEFKNIVLLNLATYLFAEKYFISSKAFDFFVIKRIAENILAKKRKMTKSSV
jgi:hypothetical protein